MITEIKQSRKYWLQTYTGGIFYPADPQPEQINLLDIAHALANLCRYAGHTKFFYSVAEHSVRVSDSLPKELRLWGLLHDAAEAYGADIPKPIKVMLPDYQAYENRVMEVIARKFNLNPKIEPALVKEHDARILGNEQRDVMAEPPQDWNLIGTPLPHIKLMGWSPDFAEQQFLARFDLLTNQ